MGKEWLVIVERMRLHGRRPCRYMPKGKVYFWVKYRHWKFRLCSVPFKGICVVGRGPLSWHGAMSDAGVVLWEYPVMRRKNAPQGEAVGKHLAAVETNLFTELVPLVEHCAITKYDDDGVREPGWITIKTQGAAWVVQVKDPDSGMSFSSVAETLDKALQTAALLLACDEAPWTPDQWLKRKGKK